MLKCHGNYFEYVSSGEFRSENEWIHPARTIDSTELIFVLEGEVYIEEEGIWYKLCENESILLEPGKPHSGYEVSKTPTAFYWIHFRTDMPLPFKVCEKGDFYDIKYLLKKLLHMSNTLGYEQKCFDAATFMIFCEMEMLNNTSRGNSIAGKLAEYIRINAAKGVNVADAAHKFGYNPNYIGKLFKKTFGVGIKSYIVLERLKYAKNLLLTTNMSVKEISAEMGFEEENLFIKYFMYHEEISPSKFRDKYFNTHMNNK